MRRYPPRFPEHPPVELDYQPGHGGRRRRAHPVGLVLVIVAAGAIGIGVLWYVIALVILFSRGINQD